MGPKKLGFAYRKALVRGLSRLFKQSLEGLFSEIELPLLFGLLGNSRAKKKGRGFVTPALFLSPSDK